MKQTFPLLIAFLLLGCISDDKQQKHFPLQGAWTLSKVEYPAGGMETFSAEGGTYLRIYLCDSSLYQCQMARMASGIIINPNEHSSVTLIDKGGGEYVYLEGDEPRPLTIVNDTTIVIQSNGVLRTWHRADGIAREWGEELQIILTEEWKEEEGDVRNYVLSAKEREQAHVIHGFVYATFAFVILLLFIVHFAITNRKERQRLQLQLQQIRETHDERPQTIRHAIERVENDYFTSEDYLSLQRRIATGQRLRETDWNEIEEQVKRIYPGFTSQLRTLYPMSELEYQTCLLIKLRIAPSDIAAVLSRDVSTISTVRSRLYQKVFGRKGSTKDWDDFILSIGV